MHRCLSVPELLYTILTMAIFNPNISRSSRRILLVCKEWFEVGEPILWTEVLEFGRLASHIAPVYLSDPEGYGGLQVRPYVCNSPPCSFANKGHILTPWVTLETSNSRCSMELAPIYQIRQVRPASGFRSGEGFAFQRLVRSRS